MVQGFNCQGVDKIKSQWKEKTDTGGRKMTNVFKPSECLENEAFSTEEKMEDLAKEGQRVYKKEASLKTNNRSNLVDSLLFCIRNLETFIQHILKNTQAFKEIQIVQLQPCKTVQKILELAIIKLSVIFVFIEYRTNMYRKK